MMMRNLIKAAIALVALSFATSAFAKTIWVQAAKTPLRSAPKMSASKTAEVKRGMALAVQEKKGLWFKVKSKKGTGWISKLFVSTHSPIGKADLSENAHLSLEKVSRKRPGSNAVAAAARGLQENTRSRENREQFRTDFSSVSKIEKYRVSENELKRFMKAGKVGGL